MKKYLLLLSILCIVTSSFSQKKLKYKDVYSVIKAKNYEETLPILEKFLANKPNHPNANYWAGKIYEAKAYKEINFDYKFKAFDYYMNCKKNVQTYDLTVVSAGRYPDITGLDSDERYASLISFLDRKTSELNHFKEKIKKSTEEFTFSTLQELENHYQLNLADSLAVLKLSKLTGRIEKIQLFDVIQYKGLLYIDASSETKKQRVEIYSQLEDNSISTIDDVRFHSIKIVNGATESSSLSFIENILNFKFAKYLGYSVSENIKLAGNIQYSEFNDSKYVNGNFNLKGDNLTLKGSLKNGSGFITGMWQDYEQYSTNGFYLKIQDLQVQKFRYEILYSNSTARYFTDSLNPKKYNANNYNELDMIVCPLIQSNTTNVTLRFIEPYNNEDEGADIILDGYNFQSEEGREVFFSQNEVKEELKLILNNQNSKGKWFKVEYSNFIPQAEIFSEIEPVKKITYLKETKIFDINEVASQYNAKVSSSDFTAIKSLVKKWITSLKEGDYTLYKSITISTNRMSLNQFTKATAGVKSVKFNENTYYILGENNRRLFLNNPLITYSKEFGHFQMIKHNGVWKIDSYFKHSLNTNKIKEIKASNVISKNPPSICDCVNETASGNGYIARKCYFYYYSLYNERQKVIAQFIKCLNEQNYCTYNEQTQSKGLESFYLLFNEMYFPNKEEQAKLDKLKVLCK